MNPTYLIFGAPAVLVLRDDRGEYEVANGFTYGSGGHRVNMDRVIEAINARQAEIRKEASRRVY